MDIVEERWKNTRKELKEFLKWYENQNKTTQDKIQMIINNYNITYEDFFKPISSIHKAQLERKIEEWEEKGLLKDYFKYYVQKLTKGNITYKDLIEILLYGTFEEEKESIDNELHIVFSNIATDCYNQGRKDLGKRKVKKYPDNLLKAFYDTLIGGIAYLSYLNATSLTNMQEIEKLYISSLQQGKKLDIYSDTVQQAFLKQRNRLICIQDEKISGGIDKYSTALGNESYINASDGDALVKFVSDHCENVTEMCEYMDGMTFHTEKENIFNRPIGTTAKNLEMQEIKVKGLALGINMPPIDNHFHWCHSTLTYQTDKTADELREMIFKQEIENDGLSADDDENTIEENHLPPKLLEIIDINNKKLIEKTLKKYENKIKDDKIENAIVITSNGEVYQCFGTKDKVFPDKDLGDKLYNAYVTHNHPKNVTRYSFSSNDYEIFEKYNLSILRGKDYKYTYEFNRNKKPELDIPVDYLYGEYGYEHLKSIQCAIDNDIYYMRWNNE